MTKNTMNREKRQLTNWEEIFTSYTTKNRVTIPTM